jgi:hypothetical protein
MKFDNFSLIFNRSHNESYNDKTLKIGLILFLLYIPLIITTETSTHTKTHTHTKTKTKTTTLTHTKTELGGGLSFRGLSNLKLLNQYKLLNSNNTENSNYESINSNKTQSNSEKIAMTQDHPNNPTVLEWKEMTSGQDTEDIKKVSSRIYWTGWAKYFKIVTGEKPKSFYKNFAFQKQMRENPNLNMEEKETNGIYKYIPTDKSFFVSLFDDKIVIANDKSDLFKTNFQNIQIDLIAPIAEDYTYTGGIRYFGSFNEGSCFKIITTEKVLHTFLKNGTNTIDYVFCLDSKEEQEKFMHQLRGLKLAWQKENSILISPKNQEFENIQKEGKYLENLSNYGLNLKTNLSNIVDQDGRWIILQSWSDCSLKCGGGTTVLHRFCIPPIGNGKPCQGESIIKKPCNVEPCRIVYKLNIVLGKN